MITVSSYYWGVVMCDKCDGDTGAFLAVRYTNLGDGNSLKSWLTSINERVGWLKKNFSGNAIMQVAFRGGMPGRPEWSIKLTDNPGKKK